MSAMNPKNHLNTKDKTLPYGNWVFGVQMAPFYRCAGPSVLIEVCASIKVPWFVSFMLTHKREYIMKMLIDSNMMEVVLALNANRCLEFNMPLRPHTYGWRYLQGQITQKLKQEFPEFSSYQYFGHTVDNTAGYYEIDYILAKNHP